MAEIFSYCRRPFSNRPPVKRRVETTTIETRKSARSMIGGFLDVPLLDENTFILWMPKWEILLFHGKKLIPLPKIFAKLTKPIVTFEQRVDFRLDLRNSSRVIF